MYCIRVLQNTTQTTIYNSFAITMNTKIKDSRSNIISVHTVLCGYVLYTLGNLCA